MGSQSRTVWIVVAAALVDSIGFGIVLPVVPSLLTRIGHVGLEQATRVAGWLLVTFALGQFVAGPIVGALCDRFGRRPVLIVSMAAFAINYAVSASAPTLGWLFLGRAIAGIAGAIMGPLSAVIADVTPPEERSARFGLIGAAFGGGFIAGPALGGLVAALGVRAPFILAAGLAGLNALAMVALLPETLDPAHRRPFRWREATVLGAFRPLRQASDATLLLVAWLLWQIACVVYPATYTFWAQLALGWDARLTGLSLAFMGIMVVLVQSLVVKRAVERLGERRTAILGMGAATATMFAYAFTRQGWLVYAIYVPGALGGLAYPAMSGIFSRMSDAKHQGALQGGLASLESVAAIVGPLLATQTLATGAAHGFPGAAFLASGLLGGIALAIFALRAPRFPSTA